MNQNYWEVVLASLLHDIGKLGQRAFGYKKGLSAQSLGMEGIICPFIVEKGYHSHQHVLYTNEFLNRIESFLPAELNRSLLISLAVKHHQPDNPLTDLIKEADHLVSAIERRPSDADNDLEYKKGDFRRIRLRPITGKIAPLNPEKPLTHGHHVSAYCDDSEVLFPIAETDGDLEAEYRRLWDHLLEAMPKNRVENPWGYSARLLNDLETTLWSVPSATNTTPEISLFDHSRSVSATAGCLHLAGASEEPFLLVVGDFSGIQRFLYDIQYVEEGERKGFAKRLRGRSFAVRMFTEQVIFHLLQTLELSTVHRILSAGGKMYLLLPNTPAVLETLKSSEQELAQWSWEKSHGRLLFNLAWLAVSKEGIRNFSGCLTDVNNRLNERAQSPLQSVLTEASGWKSENFLLPQDEDNREGDPFRKVDASWGEKLPKADMFSLTMQSAVPFPYTGLSFSEQSRDGLLFALKSKEVKEKETCLRLRIARHAPMDGKELKTFEEIADCSAGRHALGFIKADVDNLGWVFQKGLGADSSLSHTATLSRALEGFFGGYVQNLCETKFPNIYLVYSGGDDLAAVGPWNEAIDFMLRLRERLTNYTCANPNWGLSAGILIAGSRTPLLTAMEQTEHLLETSKKWSDKKGEKSKDCLTVFNHTLRWDQAEEAIRWGKKIGEWYDGGVLSVSHIRRLHQYAEMRRRYENTGDTAHLRYVYLLAYDIKRNWKDKSPEEREAIEWVRPLGTRLDNPVMEYLKFSCEYALYSARTQSDK